MTYKTLLCHHHLFGADDKTIQKEQQNVTQEMERFSELFEKRREKSLQLRCHLEKRSPQDLMEIMTRVQEQSTHLDSHRSQCPKQRKRKLKVRANRTIVQNVIKETNLILQNRLMSISSFYVDAANYNDEAPEKAIVIRNSNVTLNGQQTIISPRRNGNFCQQI